MKAVAMTANTMMAMVATQWNEYRRLCYRFSDMMARLAVGCRPTIWLQCSWHFSISFSSFLFRFYCHHIFDRPNLVVAATFNWIMVAQPYRNAAADGEFSVLDWSVFNPARCNATRCESATLFFPVNKVKYTNGLMLTWETNPAHGLWVWRKVEKGRAIWAREWNLLDTV